MILGNKKHVPVFGVPFCKGGIRTSVNETCPLPRISRPDPKHSFSDNRWVETHENLITSKIWFRFAIEINACLLRAVVERTKHESRTKRITIDDVSILSQKQRVSMTINYSIWRETLSSKSVWNINNRLKQICCAASARVKNTDQ